MPNIEEISGWFYPNDIAFYRKTFESLQDNAKTLEIGSWKGRSICSVADIILRKNITAYVVDTFLGSENERETFHKEAATTDIEKIFRDNIEQFGLTKNVVVLKEDSREVWKRVQIADNFFDFIFIDGQHTTDMVANDVKNSLPKLKKGGIMAGHDCIFTEVTNGVRQIIGENFDIVDNIWIKKQDKLESDKIIILSCWSKPLRNGSWNAKNPDKSWWERLVKLLKTKGYIIWQVLQGSEIKLKLVDRHLHDLDLWILGQNILTCAAWISPDNFFHHWALLQFKKPGVVIWSQSDPTIFGHEGNVNLLKDPKYLRPKQFELWEAAVYDASAFIEPEEVVQAVEKLINDTNKTDKNNK